MAAKIARRRVLAGMGAAVGLGAFARSSSAQSGAQSSDMDALVKAAKAEGDVVFYCAAPEGSARRAIAGYTEKYGLKASFVRISSVALQTRYAGEAQAGTIAADLVMLAGNAIPFANDGLKNGWLQPITDTALPVVKSGEYSAKFLRGDGKGAVVQIGPWVILYNTDIVKPADVPKDWPDLLNPKFKGQIVLTDPTASDAYLDEWQGVLGKYGEDYFTKLRAQEPKFLADGIQAAQTVGAGQYGLHFPIVPAQMTDLQKKGAPVQSVTFDLTSGVEITMLMSNPAKTKHPNAARLFANYVLSEDGNKRFNDDPGNVGAYGGGLPKEYQTPRPGWPADERQKFRKLLGIVA